MVHSLCRILQANFSILNSFYHVHITRSMLCLVRFIHMSSPVVGVRTTLKQNAHVIKFLAASCSQVCYLHSTCLNLHSLPFSSQAIRIISCSVRSAIIVSPIGLIPAAVLVCHVLVYLRHDFNITYFLYWPRDPHYSYTTDLTEKCLPIKTILLCKHYGNILVRYRSL